MKVQNDLEDHLGNPGAAKTWLQSLLACHSELTAEATEFSVPLYPFFTFLAVTDLSLLAIFHSESDIMLIGLGIPDREMIALGEQMSMRDVPRLEEFLGSSSHLIRFGESVSLADLKATATG